MMKFVSKMMKKYQSLISYAIFGVLTTIVNIVTYNVCYSKIGIGNTVSNVTAGLLAVAFAYVTNKIWVFDSKSWKSSVLKREVTAFVSCRLATGIMDIVIMFLCVDIMDMPAMIMKLLSNILVIILNYIFSKLIIFKKK